jgi:hypothetical protein
LVEKMFLFKHYKEDEITWKGPETEIDSFELLKVKLLSGNAFCDILIAELECKILLPLVNECKREAQIQQQLI